MLWFARSAHNAPLTKPPPHARNGIFWPVPNFHSRPRASTLLPSFYTWTCHVPIDDTLLSALIRKQRYNIDCFILFLISSSYSVSCMTHFIFWFFVYHIFTTYFKWFLLHYHIVFVDNLIAPLYWWLWHVFNFFHLYEFLFFMFGLFVLGV